MASRLIDLTVIVLHDTAAAWLIAEDEEHEGVWVPKSRVEMSDPLRYTKQGNPIHEVTMPESLATEKGLI